MKVLFVISSNGPGSGGHYHTLNHISRAIQSKADIKVVSIGLTTPKLFIDNKNYIGKLPFKWWNIWALNSQLKKVFKIFEPDVIHCFEGSSYLMLLAQPAIYGRKIIYTKCGGPNERPYIAQVASDVILFSKENFDVHITNKRFKHSNIHLISNRIHTVNVIPTSQRKFFKEEDKFNFVRIARIGKAYKESLIQALNLISDLNKLNLNKSLKLYIIGFIEDNIIFNELVQYASTHLIDVQFITDDTTKEASKLLYLADAVIGTGRGVMEAMSLGIPTLVPVKNQKYPCLLRDENFESFFTTNFSPRGSYDGYIVEKELTLVIDLINSLEFYRFSSEFMRVKACDKFLISEVTIKKYLKIYSSKQEKSNFYYLIKNLFPLLYYINVYRRVQSRIE